MWMENGTYMVDFKQGRERMFSYEYDSIGSAVLDMNAWAVDGTHPVNYGK